MGGSDIGYNNKKVSVPVFILVTAGPNFEIDLKKIIALSTLSQLGSYII